MDIVNSFLSDFNIVADWFLALGRNFFPALYGGNSNVLNYRYMLFILAALPAILGFAVEVLLSFILSFRLGRLAIFIPWRSAQYKLLKSNSYQFSYNANRIPILKRGKIDFNNNNVRNMPLLSFRRSSVQSAALPVMRGGVSNKLIPLRPRLQIVEKRFRGFKQIQVRWNGIFKRIIGITKGRK